MLSRLLTSARLKDVWRFTTAGDVAILFPKLKLRPGVRETWKHALSVWGYYVPAAQ